MNKNTLLYNTNLVKSIMFSRLLGREFLEGSGVLVDLFVLSQLEFP